MRFRLFLVIATLIVVAGCSQSRSSLPPAVEQGQQHRVLQTQALALQPFGRDVMLTLFGDAVFVEAFSPYAVNGSAPVWRQFENTVGLSNAARDPTSNLVFFENGQETIDSFDPFGGSHVMIETGDDDAISVAVDHHGAVYGLFSQFSKTPSINGFAKGLGGGPNVPPSTILAGPKTGLTSSPFVYSMAFDETNELFVLGDAKIRVFSSPQNGDVPPRRVIEGPLLQGAGGFSVDQRGDVAVITKTRKSVVLYRALASGEAVPVKTLSGPGIVINRAVAVVYCDNDNLWVLDFVSDGHERLLLYPPGWNGNARPARVINVPLEPQFQFVADMTIY